MSFRPRFIPYTMSAIIVCVFAFLISACYTLKQGAALLSYLNRAVPLDSLNDGFAGEVNRIREFAMRELELKQSKNYTRYVELDRDYLAAIVSACEPLSFTRYIWSFPVVGKVPYKGFFDPKDAAKEREKLKKKNLDVWIRGVDAFSTLGFFRDPLYSYMKKYAAHRLADLIIHELTHATIYIKNDSEFNEGLAEFIGSEGAKLYIEKYYGLDSEEYRAISAGGEDNKTYVNYLKALAEELDVLYKSGVSNEEKLSRKKEIIAASQKRFAENYDEMFESENYRRFSEMEINNAYLDLYRLYNGGGDFFEKLYESYGRDLKVLIEKAKQKDFKALANFT